MSTQSCAKCIEILGILIQDVKQLHNVKKIPVGLTFTSRILQQFCV